MITISFVRHGESTDNLKSLWGGWKDAPLSNHGMNQAKACGEFFSEHRLAAIYASPLDRAHSTAQAILMAQPSPPPPLIVSPDLREQYFGIAEGHAWIIASEFGVDVERNIFPMLLGRDEKFPEGESLNDLGRRAKKAVEELILPWVWDSEKSWEKGEGEVHLVVVSHGMCICELMSALVRMDVDGYGQGKDYRGLVNTAWARMTIAVKGEDSESAPNTVATSTPLVVRVTHLNQHDHLAGLVSSLYKVILWSLNCVRDVNKGGTNRATASIVDIGNAKAISV